jgi:hypothetical protein
MRQTKNGYADGEMDQVGSAWHVCIHDFVMLNAVTNPPAPRSVIGTKSQGAWPPRPIVLLKGTIMDLQLCGKLVRL